MPALAPPLSRPRTGRTNRQQRRRRDMALVDLVHLGASVAQLVAASGLSRDHLLRRLAPHLSRETLDDAR